MEPLRQLAFQFRQLAVMVTYASAYEQAAAGVPTGALAAAAREAGTEFGTDGGGA